ncbi:MAG: protein translocase SEC61 complex subunit gamma [Candidatus Aenigmatarchaeota archaeon]
MFNPIARLKVFLLQARRVVLVATKPDPDEFKTSLKITGIGMSIIGIIGFIVFMLFAIIGPMVGGL